MPPDPETVAIEVLKILFTVIPPATRNALKITKGEQIDPIWNLGIPYPLGLLPTRVDSMLGPINTLIQKYQPTHSITTVELESAKQVKDLIAEVVNHVQDDRMVPLTQRRRSRAKSSTSTAAAQTR
jgi:hypothetical protein